MFVYVIILILIILFFLVLKQRENYDLDLAAWPGNYSRPYSFGKDFDSIYNSSYPSYLKKDINTDEHLDTEDDKVGIWPEGLYTRMREWSPGFEESGWMLADRVKPTIWPRNRWVRDNTDKYFINNKMER